MIETIPGQYLGEVRIGTTVGYKTGTCNFIWLACPECGKPRWVVRADFLKKGNPKCCKCSIRANRKNLSHDIGPKHWNWNGGKYISKGKDKGYIWVWMSPDDEFISMRTKRGYALEHRLVMARFLGRPLKTWEFVHHKNGVKTDNRIENLELTSNGKHCVDHHKGYEDGFLKGYSDGKDKKIQELEEKIKLLEKRLQS